MKKLLKKILYTIPSVKRLDNFNKGLIAELKEKEDVYDGNLLLMEQMNALNYRIEELDKLHDEVVERQWNQDKSREEYTCLYPFERIEIMPKGEVYTCCSTYLKHNYYIGNIFQESFDEIWNSTKAKKLRYSVTKGCFEYCNHNCKWLNEGIDPHADERPPVTPIRARSEAAYTYNNYMECEEKSYPKTIALTCDESCNLYCKTCRNHRIVKTKEESLKLYDRLMTVVRPLLKECEHLDVLGSGDLFASKAVLDFVKTLTKEEFPNLKIFIITNAQLLTEKMWNSLTNLHQIPVSIGVSVDATEADTYEKIRRGAKWETLCRNLEFISSLRTKEESNITALRLQFVIQRLNFMQMKDFVAFAKEYHADTVDFQRVANWGTFSDEEFLIEDVFHPDNENYTDASDMLREICENEKEIEIIRNTD